VSSCIRTQIGAGILVALAKVKVVDGYELTFGTPLQATRKGLAKTPAHLQPVVEQGDAERIDDGASLGSETWRQVWTVIVPLRPSDDDTTSWDAWLNAADSCVRKAVYADRTFGGLAINDTVCGPPADAFAADGTWEGVAVDVTVHYRTNEDDPYAAA